MTIWWCEEHKSQRYAMKQPPERCDFVMLHGNWKSDPFCVFVQMRLVPVDNGNWGPDHPSYDEMGPVKDKTKCKVCGETTICEWCDDHERRVCTFCMTPEHRKLWDERVKVLTSVTMRDVKPTP